MGPTIGSGGGSAELSAEVIAAIAMDPKGFKDRKAEISAIQAKANDAEAKANDRVAAALKAEAAATQRLKDADSTEATLTAWNAKLVARQKELDDALVDAIQAKAESNDAIQKANALAASYAEKSAALDNERKLAQAANESATAWEARLKAKLAAITAAAGEN